MIIELPHYPLLTGYSRLFGRNVYDTTPCNGGIFPIDPPQLEQISRTKGSDSNIRLWCPKCNTVITAFVSSYKT